MILFPRNISQNIFSSLTRLTNFKRSVSHSENKQLSFLTNKLSFSTKHIHQVSFLTFFFFFARLFFSLIQRQTAIFFHIFASFLYHSTNHIHQVMYICSHISEILFFSSHAFRDKLHTSFGGQDSFTHSDKTS